MGGHLAFRNIQEIVDIELMFQLIYMFLSSLQIIRNEETKQ